MRRILLFVMVLALGTKTVFAVEESDSAMSKWLSELTVISTRAGSNTPMAFTNVAEKEIERVNFAKDVPFILGSLPSVTTSSDAGMGVGYTGIHVRGTDPTRINITANGVPVNDAESSQLYWVNLADFASSLQSIQVQRGVGTSTNGAGAFGATINMLTKDVSPKSEATISLSGGSYGTHKETIAFSSGLLADHWGFLGRLSHIASDGYIDRAMSRLNSYFLLAGYYADNTQVKLLTFNGTEKTYMAWDYASKADMEKYGRTYNPSGKYTDADGNTAYYSNQTDNYHQQNYQLIWNQRFSPSLTLNATLHYTRGDGYYEQYKTDQKLYKYLINTGLYADLVRQKKMLNDFYGFVGSLNYTNRNGLSTMLGGAFNRYDGDHFGKVLWVGDQYYWDDDDNKVFSPSNGTLSADNRYYDNNAKKTDGNIYAKFNYTLRNGLSMFADVQYRHVNYKMSGSSQEFDGDHRQLPIELNRKYDFFNPKVGLSYSWNGGHTTYASFAVAHKEPTRNDFEDMLAESVAVDPQAERLNDLEVGYRFQNGLISAGANFYYMDYDNQFVLTGAQDANGEMVARNIKDSYRMGVELTFGLRPFRGFQWDLNATLSRNCARNMEVTVINEDWSESTANVGTTRLAYSPGFILNNTLSYEIAGFRATLLSHYVSEQSMTNSGFKSYLEDDGSRTDAVLKPAFVSDLDLSYGFSLKHVKNITLGVTVYNLFNKKYESNGSCSMNFRRTQDGTIEAYNGGWAWATFSAQAPIHFLAHLTLKF
ncbi:MAG: TonB-dependent receptor [Muribaculaceae bacterium]|nr:TonB-dependent receptor [Muribaculaceae bacterium]